MKRDAAGRWQLEYPHELLGFEHCGVKFTRLSAVSEPGVYRAVIARTGRAFTVRREGTKRYPWVIFREANDRRGGCCELDAHTLPHAAERIASRKW